MTLAQEMLQKASGIPQTDEIKNDGAAAGVAGEGAPAGAAAGTEGAGAGQGAEGGQQGGEAGQGAAAGAVAGTEGGEGAAGAGTAGAGQQGAGAADSDMDDARVLAYLKGKGIEVASIGDIKPPAQQTAEPSAEEKDKLQLRFQGDVIKYGLDNNLFNPNELAAYNADKAKDNRTLAYSVFQEAHLASDPDLAQQMKDEPEKAREEILARFQEAFFETEDAGSWKHKDGIRRIQELAASHIDSKYGKIVGAADAFTQELQTRKSAEDYKGKVERVFAALPKQLEYTVDGKAFTYTIPETSRTALRDQFLLPDTFKNLGNGAIEETSLGTTINTALLQLEFGKAVTEVAKSYHAAMLEDAKLGRRNVPIAGEGAGGASADGVAPVKGLAQRLLEEQMAKNK